MILREAIKQFSNIIMSQTPAIANLQHMPNQTLYDSFHHDEPRVRVLFIPKSYKDASTQTTHNTPHHENQLVSMLYIKIPLFVALFVCVVVVLFGGGIINIVGLG